jgi:hypothetical protein
LELPARASPPPSPLQRHSGNPSSPHSKPLYPPPHNRKSSPSFIQSIPLPNHMTIRYYMIILLHVVCYPKSLHIWFNSSIGKEHGLEVKSLAMEPSAQYTKP